MLDPIPTEKPLHHYHLCLQMLFCTLSLSHEHLSFPPEREFSKAETTLSSSLCPLSRGLAISVALPHRGRAWCSKAHVKVSEAPPGTGVLLESQETQLAEGCLTLRGPGLGAGPGLRDTK